MPTRRAHNRSLARRWAFSPDGLAARGYSPTMAQEDESSGQIREPPPPKQPPPPWKGWKLVEVSAVAVAALVIGGGVVAGLSGGTLFGGGGDEAATVDSEGQAETHRLRVTTDGEGSGAVTSIPPGIECSGDCQEEFPAGERVRLKASPSEGSVFAGFSGDCSGTGQCTVNVNRARSVTATFEPD